MVSWNVAGYPSKNVYAKTGLSVDYSCTPAHVVSPNLEVSLQKESCWVVTQVQTSTHLHTSSYTGLMTIRWGQFLCLIGLIIDGRRGGGPQITSWRLTVDFSISGFSTFFAWSCIVFFSTFSHCFYFNMIIVFNNWHGQQFRNGSSKHQDWVLPTTPSCPWSAPWIHRKFQVLYGVNIKHRRNCLGENYNSYRDKIYLLVN